MASLLCLGMGCSHLRPGSGVSEYHRQTTVLGVQSGTDLYGLKVEGDFIVAETAQSTLSWIGFSNTIVAKGVKIPLKKEEKK